MCIRDRAYGAVLLMALLPLLPGLQENKGDLSRRTCWGLFTVSLGMAVFSCVLLGVMLLKIQALLQQDPCAPRLLAENSRRDLNLLLDLHHRLLTSRLMLEACLFRGESRGGHYRSDAPAPLPHWRQHSRQQRQRRIVTRAVRD